MWCIAGRQRAHTLLSLLFVIPDTSDLFQHQWEGGEGHAVPVALQLKQSGLPVTGNLHHACQVAAGRVSGEEGR